MGEQDPAVAANTPDVAEWPAEATGAFALYTTLLLVFLYGPFAVLAAPFDTLPWLNICLMAAVFKVFVPFVGGMLSSLMVSNRPTLWLYMLLIIAQAFVSSTLVATSFMYIVSPPAALALSGFSVGLLLVTAASLATIELVLYSMLVELLAAFERGDPPDMAKMLPYAAAKVELMTRLGSNIITRVDLMNPIKKTKRD